jgi:hypothetical protein
MSDQPIIIDPRVEPEKANAVVEALTSPASTPMPLMGEPPSNITELPGGFIDADGMLHTTARIREITGADEEAMAKEFKTPSMSVARLVDLILRRCVISVGSFDPVPPGILSSLLVGDRSALMLAIRILTFGRDWEVPDFPCRLCGAVFGTVVELDSIPMKKLENPMVQEIDVPLRHDRVATLALVTGAVQLEVSTLDRTAPEETTLAIDRCIRKIDGREVIPPLAQNMGMADRKKILEALTSAQPGPQMEEVSVQCSVCDQEANYTLNLIDLFR